MQALSSWVILASMFFAGLLRKARGVTGEEVSMNKDVEIEERYWGVQEA
jgi:hypothetical protein